MAVPEKKAFPLWLAAKHVTEIERRAARLGTTRHAVMMAMLIIGGDATDDELREALPPRSWGRT